jgi:signal transduction histidine kinase
MNMRQSAAVFASIGNDVLKEKLERSEDLLDRFIYSCYHGISEPIKSMAGLAMLMKKNNETSMEERSEYILRLRNSAKRMRSIMDHFQELKVLSEADAVPERIDIKSMLRSILKKYRAQLKENDIAVETRVSEKAEFCSEKQRLRIVLSQLISNAITFHDKSNKQKKISVFITSSSSGCSIMILDNGIGIDTQAQRKIYSLFYRGAPESTGAGMGLFIARQAVERMRGILSYRPGKPGSIFSAWLPNHLL